MSLLRSASPLLLVGALALELGSLVSFSALTRAALLGPGRSSSANEWARSARSWRIVPRTSSAMTSVLVLVVS